MTKKVNISTESGADVQFVSAAVAGKLKQHRKQQKLSLDELSRRAGVSKSMLSQIERARLVPDFERKQELKR